MSDGKLRTVTQTLENPSARRVRVGRRRPVLIVVQGDDLGRRYTLGERSSVLGREPGQADLVISDPSVSARHARIDADAPAERYAVRDLGSRNGTYVNGSPVETCALREGDKIWLGSSVLKFTFHDSIEERFHGEMDRLVNLDSLTGLYGRRFFDVEYPRNFDQARVEGRSLCVMMMDMDGLKRVNDAYGHPMGSHCIAEAGKLIDRSLPRGAAAARYGGDEYVAWALDLDLDAAEAWGEQIRRMIEHCEFRLPTGVVAPTISVGVASLEALPTDGGTAAELLQLADDALYRAKKQGGNQVCS